ncbi:MAG: 4-hydroxy-tetrahydrodipicolinate reductase [Candidatus Portiera sp.]|nr:4-hydroxy-tetrahydrodipicolinate reductase [Portiera sp.]
MLHLGIYGADGRIGTILLDKVKEQKDLSLTHAVVEAASPNYGRATGIDGVAYASNLSEQENTQQKCDVIVDFSVPAASAKCLAACLVNKIPMVIGTTGHSQQQQQNIEKAALEIPILQASNMSMAVNICFMLIEKAASLLGEEYDIEIIEQHHKHKIDAPSGTALEMGKRAAQARGHKLEDVVEYDRASSTSPRKKGNIGMQSVRGGKIAGVHDIMFISDNEQVTISHQAHSRGIFADGALRAARWLAKQKSPGLYSMADVLNL